MDIFPALKQKETVIKIADFSQSYLAEIKHFESVEVTEEELKEFYRKSLEKLKPYRVLPGPIKTYAHDPRKSTPILTVYKDILIYLIENPDANQSTIKNDLGFSQWEFTKHTDAMKRREYIKEYVISLGKKGSPGTYFEVLKAGFDYLCRPYRPLPGKGDFPHRLIQYLVAKQVKGIIELRGADVGWERPNGEKIAIEIEMECNDHVLTNIRRDLVESVFSRVWLLCKNEKLREEINYLLKTRLEPELLEKIDVKLMREIV